MSTPNPHQKEKDVARNARVILRNLHIQQLRHVAVKSVQKNGQQIGHQTGQQNGQKNGHKALKESDKATSDTNDSLTSSPEIEAKKT